MLKITAEEVNFIIYQFLHESGKYKRRHERPIFGSRDDSNCAWIFKKRLKNQDFLGLQILSFGPIK